MLRAALLLGSLCAIEAPLADDAAFDPPLRLLYDGSTAAALAEFRRLREAFPEDPLPAYFEALALAWRVEQRPQSREHDAALLGLADQAILRADLQLRAAPRAGRALFARGAAHGVKSRLYLFRRSSGGAAREALRMREDLTRALALDPANEDARFGLALYDYYADVLPRLLKLLRGLLGIPGGDRERGLSGIERAALQARWHRGEALWQLHEISAYYEQDQDAALEAMRALRRLHPSAPLWGLKLAEQLSLRLGLYAESALVFGEVAALSAAGHPNYAPVVRAMAELGRSEALLLDLRFEAARQALEAARQTVEGFPDLRARHVALARRLEALEGDAVTRALSRARRLQEEGRLDAAADECRAVLRSRPRDLEAIVCAAEAEMAGAGSGSASVALARVSSAHRPMPPSLAPRARLLLAQIRERQGRAADAVQLYKEVFEEPGGVEQRRQRAREALERLGALPQPPTGARAPAKHSR